MSDSLPARLALQCELPKMRQRGTALKHVFSGERLQGSVGEPIPTESQRQGPKPDRRPHSPTIRIGLVTKLADSLQALEIIRRNVAAG